MVGKFEGSCLQGICEGSEVMHGVDASLGRGLEVKRENSLESDFRKCNRVRSALNSSFYCLKFQK